MVLVFSILYVHVHPFRNCCPFGGAVRPTTYDLTHQYHGSLTERFGTFRFVNRAQNITCPSIVPPRYPSSLSPLEYMYSCVEKDTQDGTVKLFPSAPTQRNLLHAPVVIIAQILSLANRPAHTLLTPSETLPLCATNFEASLFVKFQRADVAQQAYLVV